MSRSYITCPVGCVTKVTSSRSVSTTGDVYMHQWQNAASHPCYSCRLSSIVLTFTTPLTNSVLKRNLFRKETERTPTQPAAELYGARPRNVSTATRDTAVYSRNQRSVNANFRLTNAG
ncbi:unnamed protein product [Ectocarpus sp. 13 AM-2016]